MSSVRLVRASSGSVSRNLTSKENAIEIRIVEKIGDSYRTRISKIR
jgi:hypothetical protein